MSDADLPPRAVCRSCQDGVHRHSRWTALGRPEAPGTDGGCPYTADGRECECTVDAYPEATQVRQHADDGLRERMMMLADGYAEGGMVPGTTVAARIRAVLGVPR